MKATAVLAMPIEQTSAKVRYGPPDDADTDDAALEHEQLAAASVAQWAREACRRIGAGRYRRRSSALLGLRRPVDERGMDMGVETRLGSFSFFVAVWVSMMVAMMLPGALPAALRAARDRGRIAAAPLFVGSTSLSGRSSGWGTTAAGVLKTKSDVEAGRTLKLSDGLEPSTPSLPSRD
jgi:hypothetical protein